MISKLLLHFVVGLSLLFSINAFAQNPAVAVPESREWIIKSNSYTKMLIDIDEKYSPEFGSTEGLSFYDTLIVVPNLANRNAERKEKEDAVALLKEAKKNETDKRVRQDLDILINRMELNFRGQDYELNKEVPFFNPTNSIFEGIKVLLDDQTPTERHNSSVIRLLKYAGLQNGYQPLTTILQERTVEQMKKPGLIYPSRQELEVILSRNASMVNGIQELFIKYKISGWEKPYEIIKRQLEEYDKWVRDNILLKGRTDFRLSPEKYKLELENYGIDIPPSEIAGMAHTLFKDIQN